MVNRCVSSSMLPMISRYAGDRGLAQPHFTDTSNRGQRRAQLVRRIGHKAFQASKDYSIRGRVSLNTIASRPSSSSGSSTARVIGAVRP